jgi:hypothetical protein
MSLMAADLVNISTLLSFTLSDIFMLHSRSLHRCEEQFDELWHERQLYFVFVQNRLIYNLFNITALTIWL